MTAAISSRKEEMRVLLEERKKLTEFSNALSSYNLAQHFKVTQDEFDIVADRIRSIAVSGAQTSAASQSDELHLGKQFEALLGAYTALNKKWQDRIGPLSKEVDVTKVNAVVEELKKELQQDLRNKISC